MTWSPGDDYCVLLKNLDDTDEKDFIAMMTEIRHVVSRHGFSIYCHGAWQDMRKVAIGVEEILRKYDESTS